MVWLVFPGEMRAEILSSLSESKRKYCPLNPSYNAFFRNITIFIPSGFINPAGINKLHKKAQNILAIYYLSYNVIV